MNWEAIGAVGEVVGAIGVIVSMIYLATQIRQNTLSNRVTAKQNTTSQFTNFTSRLVGDPDQMRLWQQGRKDYDSLTELDQERFAYMIQELGWYYSSQYFQYMQGAIDENEWWESLFLIRTSWIGHQSVRRWWHDNKERYNPRFREFIDGEIESLDC